MIAGGYQREFEEFVRASSDGLVRTAYLLCGDRGHAEDLTQTALVRTARRWRSARASPEAYARRVVVNLVKDRWRASSRRPPETGLETDFPISVEEPPSPDERLLRAVRQLPEGQRAVLVLRFFGDLSVAETAAALGCGAGTVKSQTARALDRLRSSLTYDPTAEKENADVDRR